jgi:hypothetical protein
LENPSPHHDSVPASPLPQLEAAPSPRNSLISLQYDMQGPSTELERSPSPIQEVRTEVNKVIPLLFIYHHSIHQ